MIATSPSSRTLTSSAARPRIVTGRAVCARNCALSTSVPSGFEHRKSSARIWSNRRTSPSCTERMYSRFNSARVARSDAVVAVAAVAMDPPSFDEIACKLPIAAVLHHRHRLDRLRLVLEARCELENLVVAVRRAGQRLGVGRALVAARRHRSERFARLLDRLNPIRFRDG